MASPWLEARTRDRNGFVLHDPKVEPMGSTPELELEMPV
jgi:hypothetical protein